MPPSSSEMAVGICSLSRDLVLFRNPICSDSIIDRKERTGKTQQKLTLNWTLMLALVTMGHVCAHMHTEDPNTTPDAVYNLEVYF